MKYGYARVSTSDQSVAIQVEELERAGCEMVRTEHASGSSRKGRTELQNILDFIRFGDVLMVTKLDRLARNTIDTLALITDLADRGVMFVSLAEPWANTDTPSSKLVLTVMAGMATFERERIRERQAAGIAKAKSEGKYRGRKPTARAKAKEIEALWESGIGPAEIARQVGVSRSSVYRITGHDGVNREADATARTP